MNLLHCETYVKGMVKSDNNISVNNSVDIDNSVDINNNDDDIKVNESSNVNNNNNNTTSNNNNINSNNFNIDEEEWDDDNWYAELMGNNDTKPKIDYDGDQVMGNNNNDSSNKKNTVSVEYISFLFKVPTVSKDDQIEKYFNFISLEEYNFFESVWKNQYTTEDAVNLQIKHSQLIKETIIKFNDEPFSDLDLKQFVVKLYTYFILLKYSPSLNICNFSNETFNLFMLEIISQFFNKSSVEFGVGLKKFFN